ncbi:hypothetical protein BU17DRAFT_69947 [Hysterangium stoloniferum]|nr:hypothetical protein BU17DRAFT_69947 [Hysterangium stoloniferum]
MPKANKKQRVSDRLVEVGYVLISPRAQNDPVQPTKTWRFRKGWNENCKMYNHRGDGYWLEMILPVGIVDITLPLLQITLQNVLDIKVLLSSHGDFTIRGDGCGKSFGDLDLGDRGQMLERDVPFFRAASFTCGGGPEVEEGHLSYCLAIPVNERLTRLFGENAWTFTW